ncbi:MAG: AzlD domain-containing protein [Actinomycetota bacterium]|nr:AzlD domain-containing protein [Actinomycetota bacterium]
MRVEVLLLFLVVGAGNYLMRFLPLFWALRRGEARSDDAPDRGLSGLLAFVGPSVIVALLVTSILPETFESGYGAESARTGLALLPTLVIAVRSGNLGLTVLVGVAAYWLVSLLV